MDTMAQNSILSYIADLDAGDLEAFFAKRIITKTTAESSKWRLEQHSHEHIELIYFVEGKAQIESSAERICSSTFNLVLYPPGLAHKEYPDFGHSTEIIVVNMKGGDARTFDFPLLMIDANGELQWLMEHIHAELTANRPYGNKLADCYTRALITQVRRYYEYHAPKSNDLCNYCMQYIQSHYFEDIDMDKLLCLVYVSRSYLSRIFKKHTGMAPMQYLSGVRIETAKRLLCSTNLSLNAISTGIGIKDPLYFSRLFKNKTGFSPQRYRKEFQGTP